MALYDKASLVLIPSGTKEGVVFSQKPTNGDGDFTFTRASSATRVNADGLIEKETQNLLLQSNSFDTTWVLTNAPTLTSGQAGYDGSNDAWKLEASTTGSSRSIHQVISSSGVQVFSVYVKAGTTDWIRLNLSGVGNRYFDIGNGVVGGSGSMDGFITDVGGGWYRCSVLGNGSSTAPYVFLASDNGNLSVNAGDNIYIQDAQLEQGLVARDYIETTTAAVEGGITDNVPRLDYTDSSCPSLLLEPQRTNLVKQSEYFNVPPWSEYVFGGASFTRTFGYESPEGNNNAYKFDVVVGTGGVLLTDNITINPANAQTLSVWMKGENGGEKVMLALRNSGSSGSSGDIITLTSEWARYDVTLTTDAADRGFQFRMLSSNGVVDQTIYVYGAQLEEGYATSYIPTYGTSVTFASDFCNNGGNDQVFNSEEGVLYAEISGFENDLSNRYISLSDGSISNSIRIFYYNNGSTVFFRKYVGGVQTSIANIGSINQHELTKIGIKYNSTNFDIFANGVKISTNLDSNSFPTNTLNRIDFTDGNPVGSPFYGKTKQVLYFPTALTDEELEALTQV